jgi:DNA-directed RNA polymerase I, II, and III subunit RPABC2
MSDEESIQEEQDYDESEESDNESVGEEESIDEYCVEEPGFDDAAEKVEIEKILKAPSFIGDTHPQEKTISYEEVLALCTIVRDANKNIIDPYHKTIPILTKYEYTRILGVRAGQVEQGAALFVTVPDTLIDSYLIAKEELHQKKLPFIIKRPIPNGTIEYWKLEDLEILV